MRLYVAFRKCRLIFTQFFQTRKNSFGISAYQSLCDDQRISYAYLCPVKQTNISIPVLRAWNITLLLHRTFTFRLSQINTSFAAFQTSSPATITRITHRYHSCTQVTG